MLPIYVDLDDVLSDTTQSFIHLLRHEFNKRINFEDIFSFDLKDSFHLTDSEYERFFHRAHQPDVIMQFAPIEGAIDVLEKWSQLGCHVSIVTGRLTTAYDASLDWLAKHKVPYHSFTMVDKYSRKNIDRNRAISMEALSEMKFCLAVEDSAAMAQHLSQQMGIPVALIDRPWNRTAKLNHNTQRYASWFDILNDFPTP